MVRFTQERIHCASETVGWQELTDAENNVEYKSSSAVGVWIFDRALGVDESRNKAKHCGEPSVTVKL